ncbi:hypothetical protein GCM10009864_73920 [Streptomyces lunalinharesii]|uniref:Uncharacterized protein n=1 Tax=Streptomyces lunalinharesii TaxID=333384 RepID=A0ABN3T0A4_9ACTN
MSAPHAPPPTSGKQEPRTGTHLLNASVAVRLRPRAKRGGRLDVPARRGRAGARAPAQPPGTGRTLERTVRSVQAGRSSTCCARIQAVRRVADRGAPGVRIRP